MLNQKGIIVPGDRVVLFEKKEPKSYIIAEIVVITFGGCVLQIYVFEDVVRYGYMTLDDSSRVQRI